MIRTNIFYIIVNKLQRKVIGKTKYEPLLETSPSMIWVRQKNPYCSNKRSFSMFLLWNHLRFVMLWALASALWVPELSSNYRCFVCSRERFLFWSCSFLTLWTSLVMISWSTSQSELRTLMNTPSNVGLSFTFLNEKSSNRITKPFFIWKAGVLDGKQKIKTIPQYFISFILTVK